MSGTMRGTPSRQGRGNIPFAASSPAGSNIPRPVDGQSEASSSVSASRQKQSKRDEVRIAKWEPSPNLAIVMAKTIHFNQC